MRGKPKPRKGKGLLAWRSRQKTGAIMKPSTFEDIVQKCMTDYGYGRARCEEIAGSAYWKTARAKYQGSQKKSRSKYKVLGRK